MESLTMNRRNFMAQSGITLAFGAAIPASIAQSGNPKGRVSNEREIYGSEYADPANLRPSH
jgi:hypothetical protein